MKLTKKDRAELDKEVHCIRECYNNLAASINRMSGEGKVSILDAIRVSKAMHSAMKLLEELEQELDS